MSLRVRLAAVVVLSIVGSACLPAGAGADAHHYLLPAGHVTFIELAGSNGYGIQIYANQRRLVTVVATKEAVSTRYEVRGARVGADRVQARFSGLGVVSVRFFQRGPARHVHAFGNCDGPRPTVRRGVVRGTIKFTGEEGCTQVDTDTARAETEEWPRQHCRYGHGGPGRLLRSQTNEFAAFKPGTYFTATKFRPGTLEGGDVLYDMTAASSRGRVQIFRRATVTAPASTFQIPEPGTYPEHVILSPPAPFAGTGTFSRNPESVFVWEGDLSVQFPGIGPISLTGTSFDTRYCALRGCIDQTGEREADAPRRAPAG